MSSSPGPSPRGTSLKTKLLVFLTALLVGLGALLGGVSLHEEQRYMEDSLREGIRKDYLLFRALWEGETERAISLAEAVRANEEWARLFPTFAPKWRKPLVSLNTAKTIGTTKGASRSA